MHWRTFDCVRLSARPARALTVAIALGGLALARLHGAFAAPPPAAADDPTTGIPTSQLLLRIHGSNTIGDKLMPALVKAFLEQQLGYKDAHEAQPPGKTPAVDESYIVARGNSGRSWWVEIFSHGSATGFRDLQSGAADVGMASDQIDKQQAADLMPKLGDLTSPQGEHVIALDGIAVIVNPASKLPRLSATQLSGIFSGQIKDWSGVGGAPGPIHIYARDENSGTWKFFKSQVLTPYDRQLSPAATRIEKSEELSAAVQSDKGGIGFIGLNYVGGNKALPLSALDDGAARGPSTCTVKTEEYFLARRLFLYTSTHPSPMVDRLIHFVTSPKAWPVVKKVGLVNTDPTPTPFDDPADECSKSDVPHSQEYLNITNGRKRLLTNFNFVNGNATLDTKAHQDMDYLGSVLSSQQYTGHRIVLIGYADQSGSYAKNLQVSVDRASAVAGELGELLTRIHSGVSISLVAGLGAQDFLKPNDTPENRWKNRRVEVWIN
jgi:phosphate transport system substrate-binding protein